MKYLTGYVADGRKKETDSREDVAYKTTLLIVEWIVYLYESEL